MEGAYQKNISTKQPHKPCLRQNYKIRSGKLLKPQLLLNPHNLILSTNYEIRLALNAARNSSTQHLKRLAITAFKPFFSTYVLITSQHNAYALCAYYGVLTSFYFVLDALYPLPVAQNLILSTNLHGNGLSNGYGFCYGTWHQQVQLLCMRNGFSQG